MVGLWTGLATWWTNSPIARGLTWVFLAIIGWNVVKRHLKEAGRQAEREANARRQSEERARMVEHTAEIVTQERVEANEALVARDSAVGPDSYDQLSERERAIAEGRYRPSGQGGS